MKLLNSFSLSMLGQFPAKLDVAEMSIADVKAVEQLESCVGHADTAAILANMLGRPVANNRVSLKLNAGEAVVVAQYMGPRLPEGCTTLPEGAKITFLQVRVG